MNIFQHRGAVFSDCRKYRYSLTRWHATTTLESSMGVIGLNPSTADEYTDDNTIKRLMRFAHDFGFDGLTMFNIFSFRATDPDVMKAHHEPVGQFNDLVLLRDAVKCKKLVCAWGIDGDHLQRGAHVENMLRAAGKELYCFGTTVNGSPMHPLFLPATRELELLEEIESC